MAETMWPPGNHDAQLFPRSNLDRIFIDFWLKFEQRMQQSQTHPPSSSHPSRQQPPDPQQRKAAPAEHTTRKWRWS
ncbi:Hypothetical predicted protein, partial [Pelobates cultripes]